MWWTKDYLETIINKIDIIANSAQDQSFFCFSSKFAIQSFFYPSKKTFIHIITRDFFKIYAQEFLRVYIITWFEMKQQTSQVKRCIIQCFSTEFSKKLATMKREILTATEAIL